MSVKARGGGLNDMSAKNVIFFWTAPVRFFLQTSMPVCVDLISLQSYHQASLWTGGGGESFFNTGGSISTSWMWKLKFLRTWNNKEMDIF